MAVIPENIRVVNIVNKTGKKEDNLTVKGNFLLILTEVNGEKTVIIRALNPSETFSRQIDIADLINRIIEYCNKIYPGHQIAIVKDHSGGASTNRTVVFSGIENYLKEINSTSSDPLNVNPDVYFNGYSLDNCVYLIQPDRDLTSFEQ